MRHIAYGKLKEDGTEVTAEIVDLQVFLLAEPEAEICVVSEEHTFVIAKAEVNWLKIEPWK